MAAAEPEKARHTPPPPAEPQAGVWDNFEDVFKLPPEERTARFKEYLAAVVRAAEADDGGTATLQRVCDSYNEYLMSYATPDPGADPRTIAKVRSYPNPPWERTEKWEKLFAASAKAILCLPREATKHLLVLLKNLLDGAAWAEERHGGLVTTGTTQWGGGLMTFTRKGRRGPFQMGVVDHAPRSGSMGVVVSMPAIGEERRDEAAVGLIGAFWDLMWMDGSTAVFEIGPPSSRAPTITLMVKDTVSYTPIEVQWEDRKTMVSVEFTREDTVQVWMLVFSILEAALEPQAPAAQ